MDRTLLERMVGAVVLVLLLVLLAPALLDGTTGSGLGRDVEATADSDKRTEVIILNAPVNARPVAAQQPKPVVVAGEAAGVASKPPVSKGKRPPQGFVVQLGSFSEQANATRFAARVKAEGFGTFVVRGAAANGSIYRVYSGPKATREAAGELAGKLQSLGHSVMVTELGGAGGN